MGIYKKRACRINSQSLQQRVCERVWALRLRTPQHPKGWKGLKGNLLCRFVKGVPWCVWHSQTIFPLNFIFSALQLKRSLWLAEAKSLAQFPLQWKSSFRISVWISLACVFALPGFLISGLISTGSAQVQSGNDFLHWHCETCEWI